VGLVADVVAVGLQGGLVLLEAVFAPDVLVDSVEPARLVTDGVEVVGETDLIPEAWDDLSIEQRLEILEEGTSEGVSFEAEEEDTLVSLAERIPRTIAFTILAFTQMFEVMAIHAGDRSSFFRHGFAKNRLLMYAVLFTFFLQLIVIYVPFFQDIFQVAPLSVVELIITAVLGSVVLFGVELEKIIIRREEDVPLANAA